VTHHEHNHGDHEHNHSHGGHDHVTADQERQRFDEAAVTWDDPTKIAFADGVAAAVLEGVPVDADWVAMDFGAGTGLLGLRLADHVAEVDLVDTSAGMAAVARERVAARTAAGHPGVQVVEVDLTTGTAPRQHYDLVAASLSLHHVPDLDGILATFAQLLAPSGWIAIAELAADPQGHFHAGIENFSGHHGFDPADLERRLNALGFSELSHRPCGTVRRERDGHSQDFAVILVTGRMNGRGPAASCTDR